MNLREKTLAFAVGGLVGLTVLSFGLRAWLWKPLKAIDKQAAGYRAQLKAVQNERLAYFAAEEAVKRLTQRTFDDTVDEASAKSGETLTRQIIQCGLSEADFTRLPVGPRKPRVLVPRSLGGRPYGASEIGWSVQGDGPLENVVNLLFVLQESPYLHRVEGLDLAPGDAPGQAKVRFQFLTLVIDPAPVVEPVDLTPKITLASPERRWFDGIMQRDLLRPYVKRPPPPGPGSSGPGAAPPAPSGPDALRIVSLSEWLGQPEVAVLDAGHQKTTRYKTGDALAGGVIVMVDYRALPMPDKAGLLSNSRVILKIGSEYWAIERGRTLAEKYKLALNQVPENLPKP